jgi:hypothetical protein
MILQAVYVSQLAIKFIEGGRTLFICHLGNVEGHHFEPVERVVNCQQWDAGE